jgi:hypothetical protein
MSETETPVEPKAETKPVIDVTTPEGRKVIFEILCMVRGIDPSQVQGMAKFMDPENVDQTTFYPTQKTSLAISQLRLYGEAFYMGEEWNEYELAADIIGTGFKGYKGYKSNQYVEITSGQQNLEKLQGVPEDTKRGILSGIFGGRSKKE